MRTITAFTIIAGLSWISHRILSVALSRRAEVIDNRRDSSLDGTGGWQTVCGDGWETSSVGMVSLLG